MRLKKKREKNKKPSLEQNTSVQMGTTMEQLWDAEVTPGYFLTQTSLRICFSKRVQVIILCYNRRKFPTIWYRQVKSEKVKTCFSPKHALL